MSDMLALAWVGLRGDDTKLPGDLNRARGSINSFVADAVSVIAQVKAAFIGMSLVNWGSNIEANAEQTRVAMNTIIKDMARTNSLLKELKVLSDATPFTPREIQNSARMLVSFGTAVDEVSEQIRVLGDLSAGSGSQLSDVALIFSQIRGEGKLLTQDFRQLATRGINLREVLAKNLGIAQSDFQAFMSSGQISFEMVQQAMADLTSDSGQFAGAMAKQAETLTGKVSTLQGRWETIGKTIGEKVNPAKKIMVNLLTETLTKYTELDAMTGGTITAMLTLATTIGSVALAYNAATLALARFNIVLDMSIARSLLATVAANKLRIALGVLAFAAIAVALMDANDQMSQLRDNLNAAAEAAGRLAKSNAEAFEKKMNVANDGSDEEREKKLNALLVERQKHLAGQEDQLNRSKGQLREAQKAAEGFFMQYGKLAGLDTVADEKADVEEKRKAYQATQSEIKRVQEALKKLKEEEANGGAEKKVDLIEEEIEVMAARRDAIGKTERQLAVEKAMIEGATLPQLKRIDAIYDEIEARQKAEDKKEEEKRSQKAEDDSNKRAVEGMIKRTKEQVAMLSMSREAYELHKAAVAGATDAEMNQIKAAQAQIKELKERNTLLDKGKKIIESQITDGEKYAKQVAEIRELMKLGPENGGLSEEQGQKEIDRLGKQLRKGLKAKIETDINLKSEVVGFADFNNRIQGMFEENVQEQLLKEQVDLMFQQQVTAGKIAVETKRAADLLGGIKVAK
jgi:tape measure domain-containing protein